jgi:hypothetical protein
MRAPNRLTRMALSWHREGQARYRSPQPPPWQTCSRPPGHGVPMTHTRRARASGCPEYVTVRLAFAGHEGHGRTGRSAKPGWPKNVCPVRLIGPAAFLAGGRRRMDYACRPLPAFMRGRGRFRPGLWPVRRQWLARPPGRRRIDGGRGGTQAGRVRADAGSEYAEEATQTSPAAACRPECRQVVGPLVGDAPPMYLASTSRRPALPPGAGQRRDHVGASDSADVSVSLRRRSVLR